MVAKIFSLISTSILLINLILYLKRFSVFSKAFKVFCVYLIYISIIQITTITLNRLGIHNVFLSHFYFIIQFLILSVFFLEVIKSSFLKKVISFTIGGVVLALSYQYFKTPDIFFRFNTLEIALTSFPLIAYSFFFFIEKITDSEKKFIYIISGFFLYMLCSTLLFITGNISSSIKEYIWLFNAFLYLTYQLLIFIEWYKHFRVQKAVNSN